MISIIVSVFNEEQVIKEKIENALGLDYPKDRLEIIISSDGSSDRTNEIVSEFNDSRLALRAFSERSGKTACLNLVVPDAKGEIILFTDANSMFPCDVLSRVVRNFLDPDVGLVTGWTRYVKGGGDEEATGVYSRLERYTKIWESLISSCVGADGAIFAMRKALYKPLKDSDINDFMIPLHVISQSKRVVLDPDAYCWEESSKDDLKEFRRQVRITNRTLGALFGNPGFLNPFAFGSFSFFLLSHKVIRFLVPFFFIGTLLISFLLAKDSLKYAIIFLAHLAFIGIGVAAMFRWLDGRLVNLCKMLLVTLAAQFVGWMKQLLGKSDTIWTPQR